jgi:hypothetical protein
MKHLALALLVATFSLSVMAGNTIKCKPGLNEDPMMGLNVSKGGTNKGGSLCDDGARYVQQTTPPTVPAEKAIVKSKSNITNNRETALQGPDTCDFTIDQPGVKRAGDPIRDSDIGLGQTVGQKRQATKQEQQKCLSEKKAGTDAFGIPKPGAAGDKNTPKK